MRAISLWQPWASAISLGAKIFETRHWDTKYRGPIAIHAAQRLRIGEINRLLQDERWQRALNMLVGVSPRGQGQRPVEIRDIPFGAIVCTAMLTDVIPTENMTGKEWPSGHFDIFGDYSPGRFAWKIEDVNRIEPIYCKGSQSFFQVDICGC